MLTLLNLTDEALFFGDRLSLPIVQIPIPFKAYIYLTPVILLIAHTFVLLLHHIQTRQLVLFFGEENLFPGKQYRQKHYRFEDLPEDLQEAALGLSPSLPTLRLLQLPRHPIPRLLTSLNHAACFLGVPVLAHILLLFRFYAYHDSDIVRFHQFCLVLCALLSLVLLNLSLRTDKPIFQGIADNVKRLLFTAAPRKKSDGGSSNSLRILGSIFAFSFNISVVLALYALAFLPISIGYEPPVPIRPDESTSLGHRPSQDCASVSRFLLWRFLPFEPNLNLSNRSLRNPLATPEQLAASQTVAGASTSSFQRTPVQALFPLTERDFTCANFSGSELSHLDFRSSILNSASFENAYLNEVNFLPPDVQAWELNGGFLETPRRPVESRIYELKKKGLDLRNTIFTNATLTNVSLAFSHLYGADFRRARISATSLFDVSLTQGDFRESKILGADFSEADLTFSSFWGAEMRQVLFQNSTLLGTQLAFTKSTCLDFLGADLRVAILDDAVLRGAIFTSTSLLGNSLLGTEIYGGVDFHPQFQRLSGGHIEAICGPITEADIRRSETNVPYYLDLSDTKQSTPSFESLAALYDAEEEVPACLSGEWEPLSNALRSNDTSCFKLSSRLPQGRAYLQSVTSTLHYRSRDREERFSSWPGPVLSQDELLDSIAEQLVGRMQKEGPDFVQALYNRSACEGLIRNQDPLPGVLKKIMTNDSLEALPGDELVKQERVKTCELLSEPSSL